MHRILTATYLLICAILVLPGCSTPAVATSPDSRRITLEATEALLKPLIWTSRPPQVLLLGEQHDAPQHQMLEREVVRSLLRHGRLAALALEMAERGRSTAGLKADADEAAVQQALGWNEAGWPWASYGPAIMLAVREEVLVLGANLPRNTQREAMRTEALDGLLPGTGVQKQREAIQQGHCGLLAQAQVAPMARIQIARDQSMAQTLVQALARKPAAGGVVARPVVLLLAGSGHVDRELGVPVHLPSTVSTAAVRLLSAGTEAAGGFDAIWPTATVPPKDYCAEFRKSAQPQAQP